jgi:hypothetical protein
VIVTSGTRPVRVGIDETGDNQPEAVILHPFDDREKALFMSALVNEIIVKWVVQSGVVDWPIKYWIHDTTYWHINARLDPAGWAIQTCMPEHPLVDNNGQGSLTPLGLVFNQAINGSYTYWGSGTWTPSATSGNCLSNEAWPTRPDQNTNNDGQPGNVEFGDLPLNW